MSPAVELHPRKQDTLGAAGRFALTQAQTTKGSRAGWTAQGSAASRLLSSERDSATATHRVRAEVDASRQKYHVIVSETDALAEELGPWEPCAPRTIAPLRAEPSCGGRRCPPDTVLCAAKDP